VENYRGNLPQALHSGPLYILAKFEADRVGRVRAAAIVSSWQSMKMNITCNDASLISVSTPTPSTPEYNLILYSRNRTTNANESNNNFNGRWLLQVHLEQEGPIWSLWTKWVLPATTEDHHGDWGVHEANHQRQCLVPFEEEHYNAGMSATAEQECVVGEVLELRNLQ